MNLIRATIALAAAAAGLVPGAAPAASHEPGSRVVVSTTLNSTLQFFDASSLEQTQPPLVSRGLGPVRMWVEGDHLFVANHGAPFGSVGVFDLSDALPVVTELPLSPFLTGGMGSVGVAAAPHDDLGLVVWATNTTFALGGCGMPTGTATAFDGSMLGSAGVLRALGSVELSGPIPYAIAASGNRAFASVNCADALDRLALGTEGYCPMPGECVERRVPVGVDGAATGDGPDATLHDGARDLLFTVNIGGDSVSVHDEGFSGAGTTVPLPGSGPIDATLATSAGGRDWLITSNGEDDTISILDRDLMAACVAAAVLTCDAEVARIPTAVPGGAPEGVAFDTATNRAFVVNKGILAPSLSVIQVTEDDDGVSGIDVQRIPLNAAGADVPIPAFIAFDVVVQPR